MEQIQRVVIGEKKINICDHRPSATSWIQADGKDSSIRHQKEALDILVGKFPLIGEEKDAVVAHILKLLKETYDIEKEDLMSSRLKSFQQAKLTRLRSDRSMVMAYGQDDRVCAFTSLMATTYRKQKENIPLYPCR